MQVFETKSALRVYLAGLTGSVGLVPTMGYLHAGHMTLVGTAREKCDTLVASLFVNPTQFGDVNDLEAYPRDTDRDLRMFEDHGVDAVFMPSVAEMYGEGAETIVETTGLANVLMGEIRPGHFRGVTTVVAKLFNIVQPDIACFGEKDYQQLQVIRRMVIDLAFPIEVIGVPTVREADGLAMSTRNTRLSTEDRQAATVLSEALFAAAKMCRQGEVSGLDLQTKIADIIRAEPRADIKSVDICDAANLAPITSGITRPIVGLLAVTFGDILLIDQHVLNPEKETA